MNKDNKNATTSKLLTPCRSVGLTRKRKKLVMSPTQNENNINSFNESSSGSHDIVDEPVQKFKNSKKKQKIMNEENPDDDITKESKPLQKVKASRRKPKKNTEEILEDPAILKTNSVDDENSSVSQDNLEKDQISKPFRKKAEIHNKDIFEDHVVIPEIEHNSDDDEHFLGTHDLKKSKHKKLKTSRKKAEVFKKEILESPVVISETGSDNNNTINNENSSESLDNVEDVKHVKLNTSRKTVKIHNEEILEAPVVIPETCSENNNLIDDENSSGNQNHAEDVNIASQDNVVPDINNKSSSGGGEKIEDGDSVEKSQDKENSIANVDSVDNVNDFNENSSSEDSEPLLNWKTRNELKLLESEGKDQETWEKLNMTTSVNIVRCDSLLEELKKSNSCLSTSQEYLDEEVADINKTNACLDTESTFAVSKRKKKSLGLTPAKKSANKKQLPVKRGRKIKVADAIEVDSQDFGKSTESLKSNISVSQDDDELSDFSAAVKPRGRKSSNKISNPSPKVSIKKNVTKQTTPKTNPAVIKGDSDDDFAEKISRDRTVSTQIEYIKKERIKIGENSSYTIVQRNNMISYIKSNDTSSIAKPEDTVQNTSSNIFIVDHKIHLPETTPSQAIDSIFDESLAEEWKINKKRPKSVDFEKKQLLERKASMMKKIKDKHDKLERLKRISVYKQEHNLKDLQELALQIKRGLQEALVDLLCQLKDQQEKPYTMQSLLKNFSIPFELVGYNLEDDNFV